MKRNRTTKGQLIRYLRYLWLVIFIFIVSISFIYGDTVNSAVTTNQIIARETINLSDPVSSEDGLVDVLSESLNQVCENLNLTINNTKQWFSKQRFDQCLNRAYSNTLYIKPYYKGYNYTYTTGNKQSIKMNIHFEYRFPRKTLLRYLNESETKAITIINSLITPDMNNYQKEIALHDYIVNQARYDDLNYRKNTVPEESYTPYGILMKGTGVCSGYAYTMKYLCDKVDIECIVVSGEGDGGDHAWNIVKIEGDYYHVDVTWDDPVGEDRLRYNYFNLSDEMIAINHRWERGFYPRCTATHYNYYRLNGLWVADMEECKARIKNAIANHEESIHMQVSGFSLAVLKKVLHAAVVQQHFYGKYSYSYDEKLGIVEIEFEYSE